MVGAGDGVLNIPEGTQVVVDGTTGAIYVDPDGALLATLTAARDERDAAVREAQASALEPARTVDGTTIEVAANIGSPADAVHAVAAGADGVGLFRTEFLFMARQAMPDAREQEAAYRETAEALAGRPLVIRTLDAGADKPHPLSRPAVRSEPVPGRARDPTRSGATGAPPDPAARDPPRGRRPPGSCHVPDGRHRRRVARGEGPARARRRAASDARGRGHGRGPVGGPAGGTLGPGRRTSSR